MNKKLTFALDLETECTVVGCPDHGKSLCRNDHSLNPWQSRITIAATYNPEVGAQVFEGSPQELTSSLEEYLTRYDYSLIGHNLKFDLLHLYRHGFDVPLERWIGDSQLAAYVLTDKVPDEWLLSYTLNAPKGTRKAGKHSLKTLAPYFLGVEPYWEANASSHADSEYVTKDVMYTYDLCMELSRRLTELGQHDFYINRQLPWTKLLLEAEKRGIVIDSNELNNLEQELAVKAEELAVKLDEQWFSAHVAYRAKLKGELQVRYEEMAAKAGKSMSYGDRYWNLYERAREKLPTKINYDSPKQMSWLLKEHLGYDITSLEGEEGTGREVLERLANEGHKDVALFLEWRKVNKLLAAFIPTYKELLVKDGALSIIHPVFNPTNTRTGRTSSERPNMQQVPPSLRPLFKARPGYKLIGFDQAAIEAKLIALYTSDPALYEVLDKGISIHDFNTKVFFGLDCDYAEIKKQHADKRAASKNVGFALFYNAGSNRIRIAFAQKGFHLSHDECRQLHERFKASYATAMSYSREVVKAMEQGEVLPNLLGRPLKIERPDDAYMQAFNTLIQSSASDLLLEGALRACAMLRNLSIDAQPLLFVHDYFGLEVPEQHAEEAERVVAEQLTAFDLRTEHGQICLEVEGGTSDKWEK
jgi:DNA polymerase I-like protein with 3'-5' exonuclease and polymerase domains